jgi:hypothetical protein
MHALKFANTSSKPFVCKALAKKEKRKKEGKSQLSRHTEVYKKKL